MLWLYVLLQFPTSYKNIVKHFIIDILFIIYLINTLIASAMQILENPSLIDQLLVFPPRSMPSLLVGFILHFICIYSTLLVKSPPSLAASPTSLTCLRLTLGLLAIGCFIDFGWSNAYGPKPRRQTYIAMVSIASHCIMRVLETCFVVLWDGERPRWVLKPIATKPVGTANTPKSLHDTKGKVGIVLLELPTTPKDRLIYCFDLITSYRGFSWFSDRVWTWAPKSAVFSNPTRSHFLRENIQRLVLQYLAMDVLETYNNSQNWDTFSSNPVTSLSFSKQILGSFSVFFCTFISLSIPYTLSCIFFVLIGSSPASWPPMFVSPLSTPSLAAFWTDRWQQNFRRSFVRLSQGILYFLPPSFTLRHPRIIIVLRRVVVFSISATLHLIFIAAVPQHPDKPQAAFLDPRVIRFFLSQPIGLVIEGLVLVPAAKRLLPASRAAYVPTVFAWIWLVGTGRWWSDVWISREMFAKTEKIAVVSLIGGLGGGNWLVY